MDNKKVRILYGGHPGQTNIHCILKLKDINQYSTAWSIFVMLGECQISSLDSLSEIVKFTLSIRGGVIIFIPYVSRRSSGNKILGIKPLWFGTCRLNMTLTWFGECVYQAWRMCIPVFLFPLTEVCLDITCINANSFCIYIYIYIWH